MENKNKVLIWVIIGLVVIGAVIWFSKSPAPSPSPTPPLGSVASPDIPSPYLTFGGVREWAYSSNFLPSGNASTTLCSFRSPDATTTLEQLVIKVATTSFADIIDVGYSQGLSSSTNPTVTPAVPTATTTNLGALGSFTGPNYIYIDGHATSTSIKGLTDSIIWPRSYINVNGGATATTTKTISGSCKLKLLEL